MCLPLGLGGGGELVDRLVALGTLALLVEGARLPEAEAGLERVDPDRGEDGKVPLAGVLFTRATGDTHNGTFFNNEISECTATQVNVSDAPGFIAGTFVWSGFDYLGEARGWPQTAKRGRLLHRTAAWAWSTSPCAAKRRCLRAAHAGNRSVSDAADQARSETTSGTTQVARGQAAIAPPSHGLCGTDIL